MMRVSFLLNMVCAVALVALPACGGRHVTGPSLTLAPECEIFQEPAEHADSIRVALPGTVRPEHAPGARNAGERLLFRHLYETLITVDCLGNVHPGLAASWDRGEGGRRWTFELREGARFWDGTSVTALDVVRSWEQGAAGTGIMDSATVAGDRILHVHLDRPHREVPRAFSAHAYAVAKQSGSSPWPLGSGPYEVLTAEGRSAGMPGRTVTVRPAFGAGGPVIHFLEIPRHDARDLLEGSVDIMVTADPDVIGYAAVRPLLATVALPWERTYVLLSTSRFIEYLWVGTLGVISPDLPEGLARDAVRGDARGYQSPTWWDELEGCGDLSTAAEWLPPVPRGAYSSSGLHRILYDSADRTARDLAERIVALAATDPADSPEAAAIASAVPGLIGGTPGMIAEGVSSAELDLSLRNGDDFAYVVAIPRQPSDPCHEAIKLIDRARWLSTLGMDFTKVLVPLVDTRPHVIVKSGKVGLIVDWYGDILISNEKLRGR